MKSITLPLILIICSIFLSNCSTWAAQQDRNRKNLLKLEIGMSKDQVLEIMGQPDLNEAYKRPWGTMVALFYYTNRLWPDGNITRDECTPVVLEDDSVVGWGQDFLQTTLHVNVGIKKE